MTAYRAWTSLVGVLCLTGTAIAQTNHLGSYDPYGVRLTRLQEPSRSPMLQGAGQLTGPVVSGPVGGSTAPETIATPQPTPGSAYQEALNNSGWGDSYGSGGGGDSCGLPSCCGCCNNWYAYVGGLVMGRDMPNRFWTTFEAGNPPNQLQYFPGADWGGGVDTRIGYWFGCGCGCGDPCNGGCGGGGGRVGIEAVYWGAWDLNGENQIYDPNNTLSAVTDVGLVSFGGAPVPAFFDNARSHRLTRENEFHNVELNFLYLPCCNPCQRFQVTAVAGVRFLKFDENLQWGTLAGTAPPGARFGDNPADEAYLNVDVENNLVGFQLGAYMNYQFCNRCSVFAIPKIGIFGNHVSARNSLYTGDGIVATFDDPPGSGNALDISDSANVFSMLGSIDVGFSWSFCCNWSLIGGYRVVAATGVALGDNQIPQFFADEAGWRTVKTNGSLILHGAFAGVEARF